MQKHLFNQNVKYHLHTYHNKKQNCEKNNHYLNVVKNIEEKYIDFENKFKLEQDLLTKFTTSKMINEQDQSSYQLPDTYKIFNFYQLMFVAQYLKKNIQSNTLYILFFYKNEFQRNKEFQQIVDTLCKLSQKDLTDFIIYSTTKLLKEQTLRLNANQKIDILVSLLQLDLYKYLHTYIKDIFISINKNEFRHIKTWRAVTLMRYLPNLIEVTNYRDLDYINEQICNIFINNIEDLTPTQILHICDPIQKLCSVNSKSCFPFKKFIHLLQQRMNNILEQKNKGKYAKNESENNILTIPTLPLKLLQIVKFNLQVNEKFIQHMEDILYNVKPDTNPFKSHLLFFNSLSVLNSGEKILEKISKLIQNKQSAYYEEILNYDIRFILKLMYNEQLLYIQKQTQNLWQSNQIFEKDIQNMTLHQDTILFKYLDEIISKKITKFEDILEFDNKTQLIFRKLYGVSYKNNKVLNEFAQEHITSNEILLQFVIYYNYINIQQQLFFHIQYSDNNKISKSSGNKMNEFNSDVLAYLENKNIDCEVEKFIGYGNCDIFIPSLNLVIELDGKYHNNDNKQAKDQFRNVVYLKSGYKLLEISILNWEFIRIEGNIQQVLDEQFNLFKQDPNLKMLKI